MKVSLQLQIRTVEREIALRRNVYARQVSAGKMRQAEADLGIEHMQAVLQTLEWLWKNEVAVRASVILSGSEDLS